MTGQRILAARSVLVAKYYSSDQMKDDKRGIIRERRERHMGVWWKSLHKRNDLEDTDINRRIILKCT